MCKFAGKITTVALVHPFEGLIFGGANKARQGTPFNCALDYVRVPLCLEITDLDPNKLLHFAVTERATFSFNKK